MMPVAPLPPTTKYWSRSDDRQRNVNELFNRSGAVYDRACDILSFGTGRHYRRDALRRAGIGADMQVLDVGTGTGLLAREIAGVIGPGGRVIGIDPSAGMLAARSRDLAFNVVRGVGERLPFGDGRFHAVTMGYALRHVPDLVQTFAEYRRVLRPGGRALLLEITPPASAAGRALARAYFGGVGPSLAALGTASLQAGRLMRFYWDTIEQCVPPEVVVDALQRTGFRAERGVSLGIFSEYLAVRD